MSVLIIVSTFGFLNLALMTAPRVYYANGARRPLLRAGGAPSRRAPTRPRRRPSSPRGRWPRLFALCNTYDELLGYAVFADWVPPLLRP
jgi:hypothetical protein